MNSKILIISGSDRPDSASIAIANHVRCLCLLTQEVGAVDVLDLNEKKIPLWDIGFWDGVPRWTKIWQPISDHLKSADGFITVTPEWGGMVPPTLKNFLLLCDPLEIGHKPNLIVSVSAAYGGVQPIVELRTSGYKNNKLCHIPDHVHIQKVGDVIRDIQSGVHESYILKRLDWSVRVLLSYASAMKAIRKDSFVFDSKYEHGM